MFAGVLPAIALAVLAGLALAQPPLKEDDGERFTAFLGLHLNIGTLDDVQARLGKTPLIEDSEGEEYEARVCYLGSNGVVSFISSVPRLELSGLELREAVSGSAEGCRELHGRNAEASRDLSGLSLGMSKAQFAAVLGEPLRWEGDTGQRLFESERKMTAGERVLFKDSPELLARGTFNINVTVTGTFVEDRLQQLRVWKLVST
jgi:hypothetical protein